MKDVVYSVENGNKYKIKVPTLALQRWIDLSLSRGSIQKLDDVGQMLLKNQNPKRMAELQMFHEIAQAKEVLQ